MLEKVESGWVSISSLLHANSVVLTCFLGWFQTACKKRPNLSFISLTLARPIKCWMGFSSKCEPFMFPRII